MRHFRVQRRGMKLVVDDGVRSVRAQMSSAPVARDVARRFLFWAEVEPEWPLIKLFRRADRESRWARGAQARRRFGRIFRGAAA